MNISKTRIKKKGKAFAHSDPNKRNEGDYYPTPYSMTKQLLEREGFGGGTILEPACGKAEAIVKVLEKEGLSVVKQDIVTGHDFLKEEKTYDYIITNPPYCIADKFVEQAKKLAKRKVAMLLRTNFLSGMQRFKDERFEGLRSVYVFTRMPDLNTPLRKDGKYPSAMIVYAWMIWEFDYTGKPTIDWIDNQEYITSMKKCSSCKETFYRDYLKVVYNSNGKTKGMFCESCYNEAKKKRGKKRVN